MAFAGAAVAAPALVRAEEMKREIKITGMETDILHFHSEKVYYDAIHEFGVATGGLALRLKTDAGITGWATSSFGMIAGAPDVLQRILQEEIAPVLVGQDPAYPKRLRSDMWKALEYAGIPGMAQIAMSAADVAIWDILGKAVKMPVYKMLGAYTDRIPVYSMCGWYYPEDNDLSRFKAAVTAAFEEGYSGAKIKVGRYTLDDDVRRIKTAMDIAGKDKRIMVDANQKFDVKEAINRGKVYQELNCFWFEEPIAPYDHAGYGQVAQALDIRIACGENEYTRYAFADLIAHHGVDVVQPDGRRAGGVSEFIEIGAIADAAKLPVASHGGGPEDLQTLLAMPNVIYMESGSFKGPSSTLEQLHMVDSQVLAPEGPGMGSELRPDYLAAHKA